VSEEIDIVRQMEEDISNAEKKPTVMVAMPAYNEELRIAETVSGVKPYADVVVVVDDGSKDKSLCILNSYAAKDARIKVFHQENQGVSVARNTGISNASADYIVFVD